MRSHSSLVKIVKCVIATGWMKSKVIWSALFSKERCVTYKRVSTLQLIHF